MIGYLRGRVQSRCDNGITLEVNGIGYEVQMPVSALEKFPPSDQETMVFTHLVWREDQLTLYGFERLETRNMFRLLLEVSGVGPRLALNILSTLSTEDLLHSLSREEVTRLQSIHGIGKKTAARLCVDLKEKAERLLSRMEWKKTAGLEKETALHSTSWDDALSALTNLGYNPVQARRALSRAADMEKYASVEVLVRNALKNLAGDRVKQG